MSIYSFQRKKLLAVLSLPFFIIILHKILYMIDLANYIIIKKTFENFKQDLSSYSNLKELKLKVRKFLSFISSLDVESSLRDFIVKQKKIAKRLLLVIDIRYIIIFVYKHLVKRLLAQLISLINLTLAYLR